MQAAQIQQTQQLQQTQASVLRCSGKRPADTDVSTAIRCSSVSRCGNSTGFAAQWRSFLSSNCLALAFVACAHFLLVWAMFSMRLTMPSPSVIQPDAPSIPLLSVSLLDSFDSYSSVLPVQEKNEPASSPVMTTPQPAHTEKAGHQPVAVSPEKASSGSTPRSQPFAPLATQPVFRVVTAPVAQEDALPRQTAMGSHLPTDDASAGQPLANNNAGHDDHGSSVTAAASTSSGAASGEVQVARFDADYLNNPSPVYPPVSRRLGGAALAGRLATAALQAPQPELQLAADRDTRYQSLAEVMSAIRQAGLQRIGFVTLPERA